MKTITLLKTAVVLLLIVNIATLSYIFFQPDKGTVRRGRLPEKAVAEKLNLTEKQQEQYKELRREHRNLMKDLRQEKHQNRRQLLEKLHGNELNNTSKDSLTNIIAHNQKKMELAMIEHFIMVRQMLTPEQIEGYNQFIEEMGNTMTHRGKVKKERSEE
ncbi:MAG: Spy/CpxP family protein refolding chaperone [Cytophagaceae bacterium]